MTLPQPSEPSPLLAAGLTGVVGGAGAALVTGLLLFGGPLADLLPGLPAVSTPVAGVGIVAAALVVVAAGHQAARRAGRGADLGAASGVLVGLLISAMATGPAAALHAARPLLHQVQAGESGQALMAESLGLAVVAILRATAWAHVGTVALAAGLGALGGLLAGWRREESRPLQPGELRAVGSMGTGVSVAAAVVLVVLLAAVERLRDNLVDATGLSGAGDAIALLPLAQTVPWLAVGGLLTCLAASRQLAVSGHAAGRRSARVALGLSFAALLLAGVGGAVVAPGVARSAPFLVGLLLLLAIQLLATRAALRWADQHPLDAPPIPSVRTVVGRCMVEGLLLPAMTWGACVTGALALNLLAVAYVPALLHGEAGPRLVDQVQHLLRANLAVLPAAGMLFLGALPLSLLSRAGEARRWRRHLGRRR